MKKTRTAALTPGIIPDPEPGAQEPESPFVWDEALATAPVAPDAAALARHKASVHRDLSLLNLPVAHWPLAGTAPDGSPVLSALVIGAGMNGVAAAAALRFRGLHDVRVLEKAARGGEGPWLSSARMRFLRSVKTLTGPCLGLPALTFRAWFTAAFGEDAWRALYKIPNQTWVDYLVWLQEVLEVDIRHETEVTGLLPGTDLVRVDYRDSSGKGSLWARHVVLATGRTGAGGLAWPDFVPQGLMPDRISHAYGEIDFARLKGKRIAILGGGSAAWDNAATALDAGAAEAVLWVRRKALPQVNRGRGIASMAGGFFNGWVGLSDADRWALYAQISGDQGPPPHESVMRGISHPGLRVMLDQRMQRVEPEGAGLRLHFANGSSAVCDHLIVATGFRVDAAAIPELGALSEHVARWRDRLSPEVLALGGNGDAPYVGEGFELIEKEPGALPGLSRIHLLNYGAYASHSGLVSDIPGVDHAGERLARAVSRSLFTEQFDGLRRKLADFEEYELKGTPFYAPPV